MRKITKSVLTLALAFAIIIGCAASASAVSDFPESSPSSTIIVSPAGLTGDFFYAGYQGASLVRDTTQSPITFFETLAGYVAEYDFITYYQAQFISNSFLNYNYWQMLIETLGINGATAAICTAAGWGAIPAVVLGTAMTVSYYFVTNLNKSNFTSASQSMSHTDLLKVTQFVAGVSNPGLVTRIYEKHTPIRCDLGIDGDNFYRIANPFGTLSYSPIFNQIGYLFTIGV